MRRLLSIVLIILVYSSATFSQAQPEMNQNVSQTYKEADKKLNKVYQQILKKYKTRETFIKNIRKAQRLWIKFRDAQFEMNFPESNSHYNINTLTDSQAVYLTQLTKERTKILRSILEPISVGLVAYYPFNGNANDESGNGNNGTNHGAVLTTDRFGDSNNAYSFNGSTSWISGSANNFPTAERTVSLWFYADDLSVGRTLFSYGGGTCGTSWLQIINNQDEAVNAYELQSHCRVNRLLAPYAFLPVGKWHHWCITTSSKGTKMYLDGALIALNNTYVNNTIVAGTNYAIGVNVYTNGIAPWQDANATYFNGKLDDIRIYNRVLTSSELQSIYHDGGW